MESSLQFFKLVLLLIFALVLLSSINLSSTRYARALDNNSKVYIVYLGEKVHNDPELITASHHQMLESLLESKEDAHKSFIYSYQHGFSGFAALLTSSQAKKLSGTSQQNPNSDGQTQQEVSCCLNPKSLHINIEHQEVIHVMPNRILRLKTTRTWDHLGLSPIPTSFSSSSSSSMKGLLHDTSMGSEAIIGVMDTGIWPESKIFNDQGLGPIPKRWRGRCESGEQFNPKTHCNKKLIGAKYYLKGLLAEHGGIFNRTIIRDFKSNRDGIGHGTHTATIAAGSPVPNTSFYGLAQGTVRGGAPFARIASYKVCWNIMRDDGKGTNGGCTIADMWKAYDDAIHDGVDVLSVSIADEIPDESSEVDKPDYVAAFHAVAKGIPVVACAGNGGPVAQTVVNLAPWLLTVAATTLDRSFPTKIILGNNQTLLVESLFTGPEISSGLEFLDSDNEENVDVKGKTVLRFGSDAPLPRKGVAAVIFAQEPDDGLFRCDDFPCILTDYEVGTHILQYIRTTSNPTVRIRAAMTLTGPPATTKVASFSSRGPNSVSPAILKPDIAAPGVSILAAMSPLDPDEHNGFGLDSGTSMSTPVVSGVIALLKTLHPNWSPAAFRSALVTTAWRTSPSGEPIFAQGSKLADPFDYGGGLVNPEKAAKPGLIYDMGIKDYINYMCSAGYNDSSISHMLGKYNNCPTPRPSILDINLPSITIPNLEKEVTLTRKVTNVGPIKSVYKAVIESPLGITLTVNPTTLVFNSTARRVLTFSVKVTTSHKVNTGYFFGSLTWTDGVHDVTIPVSVKTMIMIKP